MRNIYVNLTLIMLLLSTKALHAQKNISFIPENPAPGQTIQIIYHTDSTVLRGKKDIAAVAYLFNSYSWVPTDLSCKNTGSNSWTTELSTPKDCSIIAFKFSSGDTIDNNKNQAYAIMLSSEDQKQAPGAYAAWGLLRSAYNDFLIPGYLAKPIIDDTILCYWLKREIRTHPESKKIFAFNYAFAINNSTGNTDSEAEIKRIIAFLCTNDATEQNLTDAKNIYAFILKNKSASDSLSTIISNRFPKGDNAKLMAYKNLVKGLTTAEDYAQFYVDLTNFLNEYPESRVNKRVDIKNRISYDNLYTRAIVLGIMNHSYENLVNYVDKLSYVGLTDVFHKLIEIPYNRKDLTGKELFPYDSLIVKRIEQIKDQIPSELWYKSAKDWQIEFNMSFVRYIANTHISILMSAGKNNEALKYAVLSEQTSRYRDARINSSYALLLKERGDSTQLKELITKSLYENQASPEMVDMLKQEYVKQHQSETGFDIYLGSLKNNHGNLEKALVLKSELVKRNIPDWSMYDTDGKLITLKDLRGKIIIMDFWASWCAPCKASFPGMKLAMEKYKGDPNVVFYFIDTEESGSDYKEKARRYMKDNKFPFHVLFDNKAIGEKTNAQIYSALSKFVPGGGIPLKLFLDQDGFLRMGTTQNPFSATELSDEVSSIIELIKAAK